MGIVDEEGCSLEERWSRREAEKRSQVSVIVSDRLDFLEKGLSLVFKTNATPTALFLWYSEYD
jgi:hypothetical protein